MSVSNLFKPGGLAWQPDANNINAPDGALLRADNMVPDENGALVVRRGSRELLYTEDLTEDVHSLHTVELRDGYTYRMMGMDNTLYVDPHPGNHTAHWEVRIAEAAGFTCYLQRNYTGGPWEKDYASTNDVGPVTYTATWEGPEADDYITQLGDDSYPINFNVTFAGTGDIAFGNDASQIFMARGSTTKKFDGKSLLEWGIAKPTTAPTVTAVAPTSTSIITCESGEANITYWPNTIGGDEGTTRLAVATFVDDSGGVASKATRIIPGRSWGMEVASINKDYAADEDLSGTDDDVFDVAVYLEDPKHCKEVSLTFFVGNPATGLFSDKYYIFRFNPKSAVDVQVRDPKLEGENAYSAKVQTILDPVLPKDKPRVNTPEQVKTIVASVGNSAVPSNGASTPPAGEWIHLSVARSQFEQVGEATGRDWETVRRARIEIRNDDGFLGAVRFADLVFYSAGEGTLTGEYQVLYRWVRETDYYYELSPPSPVSSSIYLFANQLKVTIPGAAQNAADDQVTETWVYIFGGFLDTWYRVKTNTADPQRSTDLEITLDKSEIEILTENEVLEPYTDEPLDNIVAIAGPWNSRMFTLTQEGYVYPSLQTCPNLFNTYQVIDLSGLGDPFWMVKTSSGIHVGMEKDVVFMAGSGDEDADRVVIDLYPHPLNIGNPPVDAARYVDGNAILYRAKDGLITLASQGLQPIQAGGTDLLWRGQNRHGVNALNIKTGRFRLTVDNGILWMLAPEGTTTEGTTVIYRMDMKKGQWSRLVYDRGLLSILTEPDGTLVAGTNDGAFFELEYGTGETPTNPAVTILTPFMDGGNPLVRKDAFDLQLHCDTNNNTATVSVYKDGATAATASYSVVTSIPQAYRVQAEDVGSFIRAQIGITGNFDEFNLSALNLSYRVRPQHMTYLDTGYILADDPADIVWLQEVEVDANSPSNLSVLVYLDDRLYTTESVSVTANVRSVYRVPLPRGTKSRRPRVVVKTSAADGAGEVGFDPYFVRVRTRNSGNVSQGRFKTVWPAGSAP